MNTTRPTKIVQTKTMGASVGPGRKTSTITIPKDGSVSIRRATNGGFIVDRYENKPGCDFKSEQFVFTSRNDFVLE